MEPITLSVIERLGVIFNTPILMLYEDGPGEDYYTNIHNAGEIEGKNFDLQDGINAIFNHKGYSLYPFILCRDGNIYFYNNFDIKNKKIHYHGAVGKDTYKKTSANDIFELFEIDKELLFIKALESKVKISSKGVSHNLPVREYTKFIGRIDEFFSLEKMISHKRHFMSALDGIGGVGKTALAYHLCDEIAENKKYINIKFEYIIWLSAKTTKLVNGKIYNIDKAFEHLDQLLDSILDVLSFSEYKNLETNRKKEIVFDLLETANCLIVLDNLETITGENLNDIWLFICDIPDPSKVLFTSREYSFDVPQILRVEKLSYKDSVSFIKNIKEDLKDITLYNESEKRIIELSSGLPIALTSILGQIFSGKSLRSIENGIKNNTDDLSKFCFQEQLKKLKEDHLKVIILNALSVQELSLDSISFILGDLISEETDKVVNEIRSLSIVKMNRCNEETTYSMLPLIKDYVLSSRKANEYLETIQRRLNDFYSLNETESYSLLPIEERTINKGSLMPRKIVDKAMKHAENEELEEAKNIFKNCIKQYPKESYVWYVFSLFQSQYISQYEEAISSLKQAISIDQNYIYYKKIGDLHIKLKNYDTSIKYYNLAKTKSEVEKNKNEMDYLIGNAYFQKVKLIRRELKRNRSDDLYNLRSECYNNIISLFEEYLKSQPTIYDGKKIRIFRLLAESCFGVSKFEDALKYIDKAIDLSEYDESHIDYKHFIIERCKRNI
jgi:tetratricopeptide (TPR) repeat protein